MYLMIKSCRQHAAICVKRRVCVERTGNRRYLQQKGWGFGQWEQRLERDH